MECVMCMTKKIYALGFFDGVHLGHQALLTACCRMAGEKGCETAAITFDRHPQALFTEQPPKLISTVADREMLLRRYGIQNVRILPVTKEVMGICWTDFLEKLLQDGAAGFVCGDDFRFGNHGEGDHRKLEAFCRERGLPCVIVPQQEQEGIRISSTRIREALENGALDRANALLGHPYTLTGQVVSGRQLGRTIGIPTANLQFPGALLTPAFGVYACKAWVEGKAHLAVTNIGNRPTVGGHWITVEPWLLDFHGDLYGKTLTLEFFAFLRPERKFQDLQALRLEILKNAEETRKIFGNS